jgi:hypothetical protein
VIRRLRFTSCLTAVLLSVISGCSDATGPTATAALSTDASAYIATPWDNGLSGAYRFTIIAQFKNTGNTSAHLPCSSAECTRPGFGVRLVSSDTTAISGYDPVWLAIAYNKSIIVAPGETRVDTLTIVGPTIRDGHTNEPTGVMEGTYQLLYASEACNATGGCRSNKFTVRLRQ